METRISEHTDLVSLVSDIERHIVAQWEEVDRGRPRIGNRHAEICTRLLERVREMGNPARDALQPLMQHPEWHVRSTIACFLLRHRHQDARAVLEELASEPSLASFGARICLERWDAGTWDLDPDPDAPVPLELQDLFPGVPFRDVLPPFGKATEWIAAGTQAEVPLEVEELIGLTNGFRSGDWTFYGCRGPNWRVAGRVLIVLAERKNPAWGLCLLKGDRGGWVYAYDRSRRQLDRIPIDFLEALRRVLVGRWDFGEERQQP